MTAPFAKGRALLTLAVVVGAFSACSAAVGSNNEAASDSPLLTRRNLDDFTLPVDVGGLRYRAVPLTDYRIGRYRRDVAALAISANDDRVGQDVDPNSLTDEQIDTEIDALRKLRRFGPTFDHVVIDDRGVPKGLAVVYDDGTPSRVTLSPLALAPELRGQGVGAWLLRGVFQVSAERGYARASWAAAANNTPAVGLYDRITDTREERVGTVFYGGSLRVILGRLTAYLEEHLPADEPCSPVD